MPDHMTKQQLLDQIKTERAKWDDLITTLDATRLTQSGVVGQWSVKDMISHLTAWQSRPVAWLKAVRSGARPEPPPWSPGMTEEQVNTWIWESSRDRSLDAVLTESSRTHQELVDLIRDTPEEELVTPQRFSWVGEGTLADRIPGNTYEHYAEHAAQIRRWLAANSG